MTINEAKTRAHHIDPQLQAADWKLNDRTQVRLEVPVDGYDAEPWNGVTDYCLYDASGNVLAIVEAKRCSRNAREADEQLHGVGAIPSRTRSKHLSRTQLGILRRREWGSIAATFAGRGACGKTHLEL